MNSMATPQRRMVNPARAWPYRWARGKEILWIPSRLAKTRPSMVVTVAIPKVPVTRIRVVQLSVAAGNIKRGMRASQGPRRKITKSTQGVIPDPDSEA
jgi:hypothetical protein